MFETLVCEGATVDLRRSPVRGQQLFKKLKGGCCFFSLQCFSRCTASFIAPV